MVTQAQFDADTYVRREIVTVQLDWLGDELCRRTGRPRNAAGTKGDRFHVRGSHRSQEFIKRSALCTNRTYTVQGGLNVQQESWIAGFDFTPGSDAAMIAQCQRIYNAMRAGRLDEVREFYGNLGGDQVVDGWNNIENRNASSDSSHLWHWHMGIDRRHCDNQSLMERIIAIALGEEEDMSAQDDALTAVLTGSGSGTFGAPNQLHVKLNTIVAAVGPILAAVLNVDEEVLAKLGSTATAQEQADLLRVVLGARAAEVGALLAQG